MPLLKSSEQAVLHYIVRRTYGFNDASGNPKERDRISLSQFEHGIQSGPFVLDLGTGLSRLSIRQALEGLLTKGLVVVTHSCSRCLWEGEPDEKPGEGTNVRCPRCQRTTDREWQLAQLSSRQMITFLNTHDPKHRVWSFDRDTYRFRIVASTEALDDADEREVSLEEFRSQLWFPDLVDQAAEQLRLRGGLERELSEALRVRHFYQPVLELQELVGPHQFVLRYALEETVRRQIAGEVREVRKGQVVAQQANYGWHRYARAIIQRELSRPALTQSGSDPAAQLRRQEQTAGELLLRARELNNSGDPASARAILAELLGATRELAGLFEGDIARTERAVRRAFKYGLTDLMAADSGSAVSPFDFYPDWSG